MRHSPGFELWTAGRSSTGSPIEVLTYTPEQEVSTRVLAYGYPHPDEPSGATSLLMLAQALASGSQPPGLESTQWHLIFCADPDQAAGNEQWITAPSLDNYLRMNWRPLYQGLEVDYHFPIDHPPLLQPRHWAPEGMPVPLPESLALADALRRVRPDVLGLMHGNHASGAYTYLSHAPDRSLIQAMDLSSERLGVAAHRGERPDPGKRWIMDRPDVLKEKRLKDRLARMHKMFGDIEGKRIIGCVSVAQYMESLRSDTVILTPEVGLFEIPGVSDTDLVEETRQVQMSVERTRKGLREAYRNQLTMPDGSEQDILYHLAPTEREAGKAWMEDMLMTRGMAGVEAVEFRRFFLARADRIWAEYGQQATRDTSRLRERRKIQIPAARVNDPSMLIFRSDPAYRRTASQAQMADFSCRWAVQTCLWLGHGLQLYREQGLDGAAEKQAELLDWAQRFLLGDGLRSIPVAAQARSQLARLLLTTAATARR